MKTKNALFLCFVILIWLPFACFASDWKVVGTLGTDTVELDQNSVNRCDWRLNAVLFDTPNGAPGSEVGEFVVQLNSKMARKYYSEPGRPIAAEFRAQIGARDIDVLIAYYVLDQENQILISPWDPSVGTIPGMGTYLRDKHDGLIKDLSFEVIAQPNQTLNVTLHSDKYRYDGIILPTATVALEKRCPNSRGSVLSASKRKKKRRNARK